LHSSGLNLRFDAPVGSMMRFLRMTIRLVETTDD
jgi:hypothetical protein